MLLKECRPILLRRFTGVPVLPIALRIWLIVLCPLNASTQPVNRFDVVIDELFPDPTPTVGLPNSEFIELKNISDSAISLHHWKISDGSGTATITMEYTLEPDSFVIVCPNAAVAWYREFGNVIGVSSFPSLNNDGDAITLYSADGKVIHAISYTAAMYRNDIKKEGGWTLEMIDPLNPCNGKTNWKASVDPAGGTPGKLNATNGANPDDWPPALIRTYTIDSGTLVAVFDETLDSASAASPVNYALDKGIGQPVAVWQTNPVSAEVNLKFAGSLPSNTVFQLKVQNIADCAGNPVGALNTAWAGQPQKPTVSNIVINEVLFNPPAGGYDYIELYNRSNNIIDLQQLYLSNRRISGGLTNVVRLSESPFLFFPGEYKVVTESSNWLHRNFVVKVPFAVLELPSTPSLPDDKGIVVLTNASGQTIDALQYHHSWHFPLINNEEGIALERINYNDSTNKNNNWTSAATTAGFGTPGYVNSQFRADLLPRATIVVSPRIFSPDNSGMDDFVSIHLLFNEPGYVISITIFDNRGRPVRRLVKNALAGIQAVFRWDGLNEQLAALPMGNYIVFTEIFNTKGKVKRYKNVVTLARRF